MQNIPLKQLSEKEGSRTLGMKLEPGLNFNDATKFIIEKMVKFQTSMKGAYFTGNDASVAY